LALYFLTSVRKYTLRVFSHAKGLKIIKENVSQRFIGSFTYH
jgi:hypothetical protein